jgi:hypothetical protein
MEHQMKRFFLTAMVAILAMISLVGCSCTPQTPLVFNNNFFGGESSSATVITPSYQEVLTYDVSFNENFNASLQKDETLSLDLIPKYKGTYVSTFKGLSNFTLDIPESNINFTGDKYYIETRLDLEVKVNDQVFNDVIFSQAYFYSSGNSFAPVFTKTIQKQTYVYANTETNKVTTQRAIYVYTTAYNTTNYTITKQVYNNLDADGKEVESIESVDIFKMDTAKLVELQPKTTHDYSVKQAIDNTQLMFAIRNVDVAVEKNTTIPTISPTYGKAKDISVSNKQETTLDVTMAVNGGETKKYAVPVKNMTFVIGGTDNVGTQQFVAIQKNSAENKDLPNKALLVQYAEPIVELGNCLHMGALVYNLKSVQISE